MHDIRAIRDNPEAFVAGWSSRGVDDAADVVARILALDVDLRAAQTRGQDALAKRNAASKAIGAAMDKKDMAEADRLKSVLRANLLVDGSRRENSAEHSWHLALYALVFAGLAGPGVDAGRVIRMLLLHDLVEVDVGDVPLHSAAGQAHGSAEIQAAEARAARRIFGLLPEDQARDFLSLWQEFEAAATPDAIFAKSLDRCQPVMQNLRSGGIGWVDYGVTFADIESRVGGKIAQGAPALWQWLRPRVQEFLS